MGGSRPPGQEQGVWFNVDGGTSCEDGTWCKLLIMTLLVRDAYLLFINFQRGKSENKFYAAMRDKEALENERKNLTRNIEKQTKVIERLQESEKNLTLQVVRLFNFLKTRIWIWLWFSRFPSKRRSQHYIKVQKSSKPNVPLWSSNS